MRYPVWQKAAAFAARAHHHQHRDDGRTPYFTHPARVATIVACLFKCDDEAAIAAAYLHDVLEDSSYGYDDIKDEFGKEIATLVVALTKNMMLPKRERTEDYYQRLAAADWRARLVKLADEFDNYADTLTGLKHGRAKEARKSREVIALARKDVRLHPPVRLAVTMLTAALRSKP